MAEQAIPFGKYLLLERINVGGMAEVFKARALGGEGVEKLVAIKRILPTVAEDEEFIRMFVEEAKITSQLSHAHLARTFDLGIVGGSWYLAMEYVPGKDLRSVFERLKRRGAHVPSLLAAYLIARICEGLDHAHTRRDLAGRELGIVHRDVSPQNIVCSYGGEVKLIDFGIARTAQNISRTQAGVLKGKFGYMSPEQVRGLALDARSDVFAAGVVLYELCTGERLFTGASDYSVLDKVQQARVTPPARFDPAIPPRLERIILQALAREPADRFQSAGAFATALDAVLLEGPGRPVTREDVGAFMRATFADELRGRFPDPDRVEAAPRANAAPAEAAPTKVVAPRRVDDTPAPSRWRTVLAALLGAAAACALATTLFAWDRPAPAPAPAPAKPAGPAVPATELLVLSQPPGADLFVDGEPAGRTPAFLRNLDGRTQHAIVLENPCRRSWQLAVPARAGRRDLAASLRRVPGACASGAAAAEAQPTFPEGVAPLLGFLSLRAKPDANVLVDGVDIGRTTPLSFWPLRSGPHRVELVKGGLAGEIAVDVRPGESRSETVDLAAARRPR